MANTEKVSKKKNNKNKNLKKMTNWKTFKITEHWFFPDDSYCYFDLDNYVSYRHNDNQKQIYCSYISPFKNWEKGDYIEIDLDKILVLSIRVKELLKSIFLLSFIILLF